MTGSASFTIGPFYDGALDRSELSARAILSPHVVALASWERNRFRGVAGSDGTTHLFTPELRLAPNPRFEVAGIWPEGLARIGSLQANGVALEDEGTGEEVLKTSIAVRDATLPSDLAEGLGETLDFLDIDASVVGSIPSERGTNAAITAWRDAGGTLELTGFRVRWGPLGIETSGTIALDGAMRPIAALTADIIGYGDVIDALIMSNLIPLGDGFIAKVAFNMLAERPEDGSAPVLRGVPVTAQDGTLTVATIKLAELPPLPLE